MNRCQAGPAIGKGEAGSCWATDVETRSRRRFDAKSKVAPLQLHTATVRSLPSVPQNFWNKNYSMLID